MQSVLDAHTADAHTAAIVSLVADLAESKPEILRSIEAIVKDALEADPIALEALLAAEREPHEGEDRREVQVRDERIQVPKRTRWPMLNAALDAPTTGNELLG